MESDKDGLDFENILSDLEEHKIYFSSEPSIANWCRSKFSKRVTKFGLVEHVGAGGVERGATAAHSIIEKHVEHG